MADNKPRSSASAKKNVSGPSVAGMVLVSLSAVVAVALVGFASGAPQPDAGNQLPSRSNHSRDSGRGESHGTEFCRHNRCVWAAGRVTVAAVNQAIDSGARAENIRGG